MGKREEARERTWIDPARETVVCEDRLDLRGEDEPPFLLEVVERLLAEAVAGEEERPRQCVPDGQGEHPVEPRKTALVPLLVRAQHELPIFIAADGTPSHLQLSPQLGGVEDRAVEDEAASLVLVPDGLCATRA